MLNRQYELLLPMGGLYGVSFYDVTMIPCKDGYHQEPIDGYSLPWSWFVNRRTGSCVRAFLIEKDNLLRDGIRVMAASVSNGSDVYDIPTGQMLVHDLGRIWAMTPENFDVEYYSMAALIGKIPENSSP